MLHGRSISVVRLAPHGFAQCREMTGRRPAVLQIRGMAITMTSRNYL